MFNCFKNTQIYLLFPTRLGDQKEAYPYTEKARLEVSGLLKGKLKQINWRVKSKFQQSEQSNDLQLPIYVIITEFSKPISKMLEK
ncbi:MAG: hypothetical protein RIS64_4618 [Bacteroidota bacterium]